MMSNHLSRTRFALSEVKAHLKIDGIDADVISSYLVQYLLVAFYSEMEETVASTIRTRLHFNGDKKLETFVCTTNEKMIGRIKKSEIKDVLKVFGCEDGELLEDVTEEEIGYYSAAISNRHKVSHSQGATITLTQFERAVEAADKILDSLKRCLA